MEMGRERVDRLAELARLSLTGEEAAEMAGHLERMEGHLAVLARLEWTGEDAPCREDALRDDRVEPSLPREALLSAAPATDGAYILVPRTVKEGEQ